MVKRIVFLLCSICVFCGFSQKEELNVKQVTGIIVSGDSMYGVPHAHVYNKKTGLGTTSNRLGYFTLTSKVGDSLVVRSMGYTQEVFAIPNDSGQVVSILIELNPDTLVLPVITIRRFPSEKIFKEAFLAMDVTRDLDNVNNNLNSQILRTMLRTQELSPSLNHQYFMNMQNEHYQNAHSATTVPLMNPFAWSRFFQDLKREKEKKEKREQEKWNKLGY